MRFLFLAALAALIFSMGPAIATQVPERQCSITPLMPGAPEDEEAVCPTFTPFMAIDPTTHDAVRSNIGQAGTPIDAWDKCRYVDNNSSDKSFFIPFKSELEWFSLITSFPTDLNLATCARPTTAGIVPNSACADPAPASSPVNLPYARTGTVRTESATFACAPPAEGCSPWTQTVHTSFTALNSDLVNPSWIASGSTYSGSPPDLESCSIEGACGPAHGTAVPSAPGASLCDAGDATAVSGSGPWNWNCLGANGGSDATCTAPISAQAGVCGPANGVEVSEAPTGGLCTTGTASEVAGSGPWAWTCAGIGSGEDASCNAPISGPVCAAASTGWNSTSPGWKAATGYALDPTSWVNTGATLPGNLGDPQVAVIGDYVYLFGGQNGSVVTRVIYRAPVSDPTSWTNTGAMLPGVLGASHLAVIGDYVYLFGGYISSGKTAAIYRAPVSNPTSWTITGATLPSGLSYGQIAIVGDYVYLFGGYSNNGISGIYRALLSNPTSWTNTGATLPSLLAGSQLAVIGDYIYLFGGNFANVIYRAPISNPTAWTDTGATIPGPLFTPQLAIVGDYVYLFGGHNGSSNTNVIYRAPVSDPLSWTNTGATLPGNVGYSQLAIVAGHVYLFGGGSEGSATNRIYRTGLACE